MAVDELTRNAVDVLPEGGLEQKLAREHLARPSGELEQEAELGGGELEVHASFTGAEAFGVDLEVAEEQARAGSVGRRASQRCPDPRDQLR